MNGFASDLRNAWRALLARPAFFVTATLTLTLGIGAVAAIFTVYDAVLLKPLPFADAERIVRVTREEPPARLSTVSAQAFAEWRDRSTEAFDSFGAYANDARNLVHTGDAQRLIVYRVTPGFWNVFGQPLALGNAFGDDEESRDERVVVLSDALWRSRFGGDAGMIGRDIQLDDDVYRVIGVAAPTFRFPSDAQVWIPTFLPSNTTRTRAMNFLRSVAHLRPGVSLSQAQAVMDGITQWQLQSYPDEYGDLSAAITPLQQLLTGDLRQPLRMLLLAAALVLLIACANLANLMLARGQGRAQELALRSALGASRLRLTRQVFAEAVLIAGLGAALGLAVANPIVRMLLALAPDLLPAYNVPGIDLRVIVTTTTIALATLLVFGIVPAWRASRTAPVQAMQGASRSQTGSRQQLRARSSLVATEVALAMTLLAGAGLLIDSLKRLGDVDSGVASPQLLTAQFSIAATAVQTGEAMKDWAVRATAQLNPRFSAIEARLREIPGVESVALSFGLPASGLADWSSLFQVVGEPIHRHQTVQFRFVSVDYFKTFAIPVHAGRAFNALDGTRGLLPTELLVNQAFADRYLAGSDPLTRQIRTFGDDPIAVVGVVGNVRQSGLDRDAHPEIYFPISKALKGELSIALRVPGTASSYIEPLRQAMRDIAPDAPVYQIRTMDEVIGAPFAMRRFNMILMSVFAGVALLLAAIGLYGVIAYTVGQRRREIGLRQAIGANRAAIHRLMLGVGLRMIVPGLVIGLVGALALGQLISSQLYGVGAADPLVLASVVVILTLVALAACAIPTLRAARLTPMEALSND